MSRESIRVGVLDGHRIVAEAMAALLSRADIEVAVTVATWNELIEHASMPVDVVVLDLHLGDGILIAGKVEALTAMGCSTVVISAHADARSVRSAMRAGAHAFVAKADTSADLVAAIRSAAVGRRHLAEHRTEVLDNDVDIGLGPREERALVLYASGRSVREVAAIMATTDETVKSYIKRGRRKFREAGVDVGTRVLLRAHALNEGWLTESP